MAVTVEKSKGRAELLDCMLDVRKLLFSYNDCCKGHGASTLVGGVVDRVGHALTGLACAQKLRINCTVQIIEMKSIP